MELGSPMTPGATSLSGTPLLAHVERGREARRQLHGRLCRVGVLIRLITFINGLMLLGAAGYSLYYFGIDEVSNPSYSIEWRVRSGVEYFLSTLHRRARRRSIREHEPHP